MSIDFSSDVGRVKLRIGDVSDLPFLPDSVVYNEITAAGGNLPKAAQICAQYILAQLAFKTHKKMVQLEVFGAEAFENYRIFLIDTISNPAFMSYSPIAYGAVADASKNPLLQFQTDWNRNWTGLTQDQQMHLTAIPNDFGNSYGLGNGTGNLGGTLT